MSDDIVSRLRGISSEFPTLDRIMDCEWTNAADEIERLRLLLASSRHQVEQLTALMREWARADSACMKANAPTIESFNRLMSAEHAMRHLVGMPQTEESA